MNNESMTPKPATGLFYGFMLLFGVGFLLLVPVATKPGPENQGWWTQPFFMPTLSLLIVAVMAIILSTQHFRARRSTAVRESMRGSLRIELLQWLKPLEFFVYYVLYIWLLGMIGYFLSSLVFILLLSWRVGLRSPKWMVTAFLFAVMLIALFRWGLGVWVPQAELYELFPKDVRIFLMRNF